MNIIKLALFISGKKGFALLESIINCDQMKRYNIKIEYVLTYKNSNEYFQQINQLCFENNIKLINYLKTKKNISDITDSNINLCLVVGFGYLIPKSIKYKIKYGVYVFHDSLLPNYRGWAPSFWAIINNEKYTGTSLIELNDDFDTGDILFQQKIRIDYKDTITEVEDKVISKNTDILNQLFNSISKNKEIKKIIQNETKATYAIWRKEEDCRINWADTALNIYNLIRACKKPYYLSYFYSADNEKIYVIQAKFEKGKKFIGYQGGKIFSKDKSGVQVICGDGLLIKLITLSTDGTTVLPADSFFNKIKIKLK